MTNSAKEIFLLASSATNTADTTETTNTTTATAKSDEKLEKREILLWFAEREGEGYCYGRKVSMETDITELRFHRLHFERKILQEEIKEFERKGFAIDIKNIDLKECTTHELTLKVARLRQKEVNKNLLVAAFHGLSLLLQTVFPKEFTKQKIICKECSVENFILPNTALLKGVDTFCYVCKKERVQIYQPQCGHTCLCRSCFEKEKKL